MFKWLKFEKWAHVKTIIISDVACGDNAGRVFVHLLESNKGNRKIKYASTFPHLLVEKISKYVITTEIYNLKIERWLQGRYDPEIPSYSQIGEEDTANSLRGKVE